MLRMIFVAILIVAGAVFSTQGPFQGLLFYIWNAYFRPEYWVFDPILFQFHISLIVAIYIIVRTAAKLPNPQLNPGTILLWLFFAQALVGTVMSEAPARSWIFFDQLWRIVVITYLIVVLVDDRHKYRLVLVTMVLSLGFEAAKQGWANFFRAPGQPNTNPYTFLGDNNGVAMGMMMLLPIIGALIQTTPRMWEKNMFRFVGIGVLLRGISTYSRGGFLGAVTLVGVMLLRSENKFRAVIVAAILSVGIYNLMPQEFWDRMDTITIDENGIREESADSRLYFWQVAQKMADAKPLTGVGLFAFSSSFSNYDTEGRFRDQERQTHSAWYGILAELGYPGLVLLAANMGWAFWSCWRTHRMSRGRPELREVRIYGNAMIGALAVYAVCAIFLSAQYLEMTWHLFGMANALSIIAKKEVAALAATSNGVQAA
ncbi:MAG TPA: putative O-glycosylation ligase, exosortase A system-associated [Vicinamibacterales bacterium]|nr:putative O-glycosylation ligase, exosortase A system-associated [Vicinamibacterales bacterium]